MKEADRFPLPASHARAPFRCTRLTAALALAIAFSAGFAAAVWTVGLILTSTLP